MNDVQAILFKYISSISRNGDPTMTACAMLGFQLALGMARLEPAFMAEMASHMEISDSALTADVADEMVNFFEHHLRLIGTA